MTSSTTTMRLLAGIGLLATLLCGCGDEPPTQIVVAVATDLRVPEDLDRVQVWVERGGSRVLDRTFNLGGGADSLPGTIGVLAGSDPAATVSITVRGQRGGALVVQRQARLTFVSGTILLLRMDLWGRCVGSTCPGGQTCTDTGCKPIYVDSAGLPPYGEAAAFPQKICANGKLDIGEQCDGTQQGGKTCKTLGYSGGGLSCTGTCTLDTKECHKLLDPGGIKIASAPHKQWYPRLAAGSDGRALVVWEDYRKDGPGDIIGTLVDAAGKVQSPAGVDLSQNASYQYDPVVASNGKTYLVVWGDSRNQYAYDVYGTRVSMAGKVLDPQGTAISTASPKNPKNLMAMASDGSDYLVVWAEYRNSEGRYAIFGKRVSAAGKPLGADFRISDQSNAYSAPALAHDRTSGNYLVVFNSCDDKDTGHNKPHDVHGVLVSKAGKLLASPGQISICAAGLAQHRPAVAMGKDSFMVVWLDGRTGQDFDVYGARVDRAGKLLDPTGIQVSRGKTITLPPAIAHDGVGKYLVVRSQVNGSQIHLYGTRLDLSGKTVGSTSLAISQYKSWKQHPFVARLGARMMVVWTDLRNGFNNDDIYGARLVP